MDFNVKRLNLMYWIVLRPSLEEIRSWAKSFDKLMRSPGMIDWFNFLFFFLIFTYVCVNFF